MMKYLYAYDGSGRPMTCPVEIVSPWFAHPEHGLSRSVIRFTGYVPPLDSIGEVHATDTTRVVFDRSLSDADETLDLASFNFLD